MAKVLRRDESVEQIPYIGIDRDGDGYIDTIEGVQYGKTANGIYMPVRVDANGRQEVVVTNAAGTELFTKANPGNIVANMRQIQTIFASGIYTTSQEAQVEVPEWAKGVIIRAYINAVSGTFGANQGFRLITAVGEPTTTNSRYTLGLQSDYVTGLYYRRTHYWYPGASRGEATDYMGTSAYKAQVAGVSPHSRLLVKAEVSGTFVDTQGIDFRVDLAFVQ